jgi:polyisoprenoid-binding protein YceI
MKKIIFIVTLLLGNVIFSQKLITRSGEIKFEASIPAFEEVAAKSNSASCILDMSSGDLVALILVKGLKFKVPLMEEHFNENYIESSQFPKATFKGKFVGFDVSKLSTTKMPYDLEGDLTLHGVTKKIKVKAFLSMNEGKVGVVSNFLLKPIDYEIKIPNIVRNKVAEDVKIAFNFRLESK